MALAWMATSKPTILSWEKDPMNASNKGLTINAPFWKLPKVGNALCGSNKALGAEVNVPLVASGQLDHVT